MEFPEPGPSSDVPALLLRYLDFYRDAIARKVRGLTEDQARTSVLPSGWSPVELVKHLTYMERRWLVWGFLGEDVADPWGDDRAGRWHVEPTEPIESILAGLHDGAARTRSILTSADLSARARPGGRFPDEAHCPSLAAIVLHVVQEYARHAGHLDVVRELLDGHTGE